MKSNLNQCTVPIAILLKYLFSVFLLLNYDDCIMYINQNITDFQHINNIT